MAEFFGKNPDELLAMADKVAADVLAIISDFRKPLKPLKIKGVFFVLS